MNIGLASPLRRVPPLTSAGIGLRLQDCPRLPSLGSISAALRELLDADSRYTSQIAEIIRRDPPLTARVLRLVNSAHYGFTTPTQSVEEAVFFLGVRQIRQLAMLTPIIDDFQRLAGNAPFHWREFWRHSIATAMLSREISAAFALPGDESDYVAGLVHDVGRIVMASVFPAHFLAVVELHSTTRQELSALERETLGMDHADLGALYLRCHRLPALFADVARFHHAPGAAGPHARAAATVQVADALARSRRMGCSGNLASAEPDSWLETEGWAMLSGDRRPGEIAAATTRLRKAADRLPSILDGLV